MEFKKIQLNGFKSFAEKTNFLIEVGLTGIVGPNGCGKSNIVESLRWVMGETSAKSMRGSGMEDVIFSGTSNKPSKNIAEVSISIHNESRDGPMQYKNLDNIEIRRKIVKDKGSKFYINEKEVRARDAQMFFADLSTGAHSPSIISQGRIGALVTAKPTDRRAILEEAAGIAGLHVRRHEAELRLSAAENNLKRADELRRQQEKQLANLQKQAEEATKYKLISEEIKKIEAGLYYLRLIEIDKEIRIENEINTEAEGEVSGYNNKIHEFEKQIKSETDKVTPLREKNIENLSKIQRLNLELQNLDEENTRIQDEIEAIKKSIQTLDEDITRERGIIIDANSNEKRLKEEKTDLIEDLKKATIKSIKNNEAVWFGCDVGKMFSRDLGIMDMDLYDYENLLNTNFKMDKATRLEYGDSLMTHAMLFTGVDIKENKPQKWRVENSWGNKNGDQGYYLMSDNWFNEYNYEVVVDKKYLSKKILSIFDLEPNILEPWDPMGALAVR